MNYRVRFKHETDSEFLEHYGIPGQKPGVRRYQNEDGSLTDEGKRRYGVGLSQPTMAKSNSNNPNRVKSTSSAKSGTDSMSVVTKKSSVSSASNASSRTSNSQQTMTRVGSNSPSHARVVVKSQENQLSKDQTSASDNRSEVKDQDEGNKNINSQPTMVKSNSNQKSSSKNTKKNKKNTDSDTKKSKRKSVKSFMTKNSRSKLSTKIGTKSVGGKTHFLTDLLKTK